MVSFNLYVRSDNTFLKSNIQIKDIVSFSLANHNRYAALIDQNNMFGSFAFYDECIKANLTPIIGVEFNFLYNDELYPLILIAKSELGYKHLVKLTSTSNQIKKKYLEFKDVSLYSQDLIAIASSETSFVAKKIEENNFAVCNDYIETLKSNFKEIYLGVYRYKGKNEQLLSTIKDYFKHNDIKPIAMQMAIHKNEKDTLIVNILDSIKENKPANKEFLFNPSICNAYLKNDSQLAIYYDVEELNNLNNVARSINIKINKVNFSLPSVEANIDDNALLKEKAFNSLIEKGLDKDQAHLDRFNYEYEIITKMGFAKYYLVVADYVNYAKNNDIPVGPSRGSGGASLLAYLLNITSYDPLPYNLLFERFLNPSRSNYPDFDIDFADIRRDEVIEYVKAKYGVNNVAHIATFATFGVKSAIRDVARCMKISSSDVDYVLKFLSSDPISIESEYKNNEKFKNVVDIHGNFKTLIAIASKLEGLKRQVSIHAAGMIISRDDLTGLVPTFEDKENDIVIQYDFMTCERLNLIKFDFLGLTDLSIIDYCFNRIKEKYNEDYSIANYSFDEPSTYELINKGFTFGVFQLESEGMKNVISKLKPNCFADIVALISLYRPGPMSNIDTYISNKQNKDSIKYIVDSLNDILKETNGIIIYQEQIMQIVQRVASYSLGEADLFRRAISKKKVETLKQEKEKFIKGCLANNIDSKVANELYALIFKFASYGFNKAHAVGYGIITCIMASLKSKYPEIFYEAMLIIKKENGTRKINLINEARANNIEFMLPSINKSDAHYKIVDKHTMMFGLADIVSIKENIASLIIEERNKGEFKDHIDFLIRMAISDVSIEVVKDLIYSGALDEFNIKRGTLIYNLESLYSNAMMFRGLNYRPNSYLTDFGYIKMPYLVEKEENDIDVIKKEYELLGVYISKHPLTRIKEKLNKKYSLLSSFKEDDLHTCLVRIISIESRKTKENKDVINLKIEDESKMITCRTYNNVEKYLNYKKDDIVEVLLKMKNGYFYINDIRKGE